MKSKSKVIFGVGILSIVFMQTVNADITHTFTNNTNDTITIEIVAKSYGTDQDKFSRKLILKPLEKNQIEYKANVFLENIVIAGPTKRYVVYDVFKISKMLNEPILELRNQSFNIIYTSDQRYALQTKEALYKPMD